MKWPQQTDFSSAIQNPSVCFADSDLKHGEVAKGRTNRPLMFSGGFAVVYKVSTGGKDFAIRCFTSRLRDQQDRYRNLSEYLKKVKPEAFLDFEYLDRGIKVQGEWYPIVKLEWVNGQQLDRFVNENLHDPAAIGEVCARLRGVHAALRGLRIAHNALQHGDILVRPDRSIRLLDYDPIFLPQWRGQASPETGHKNYSHPMRRQDDYDERMDNFPSLVIHLSLLALSASPGLWGQFYNQGNLILTNEDLEDPANSHCFSELKNSRDDEVRRLAHYLEEYCSLPVGQVPDLETVIAAAEHKDARVPLAAAKEAGAPLGVGVGTDARPATGRPTLPRTMAAPVGGAAIQSDSDSSDPAADKVPGGASGLRRLFPFGRTHSTEAPIDSTDVEPAVSDSSDSASAAADAPVGEAAAPANPVSASTIVVVVLADRINQPPE